MMARENPLFFWWNVLHKITFFTTICLVFIGLLVSFSLSYSVSEQLGVKSLTFFIKQTVFAAVSICIILFLSFLSAERIKWICFAGILATTVMLILTLLMPDIKGSRRWLNIASFTLQPSELLKPFFIYVFSFLFTKRKILSLKKNTSRQILQIDCIVGLLYVAIISLLYLQPDFGMILTFTAIIFAVLLVNLNSTKVFIYGILIKFSFAIIVVFSLGHVEHRIRTFLLGLENYQSKLAAKAIQSGGFFGKGIAESQLKFVLPEAHNDFIFAILIEEFGFIFAGILGLLFLIIILSNFAYIFDFRKRLVEIFLKNDPLGQNKAISKEKIVENLIRKSFSVKSNISKSYINIYKDFIFCRSFIFASCILIFFEFFMNASVSLNLVPTKGMAMPFISYGGSSIIAHGILIGILLTLNKKRYFFLI